jgi:hypothetical protein
MRDFWFSHKAAEKILPQLLSDYKRGNGIFKYKDRMFPEMPLPNGISSGSSQHFNWWFVTTMTDHAVVSKDHYPRSKLLYETIQEEGSEDIFDPQVAADLSQSQTFNQLERMCFGANNHPDALINNSRRLRTEYGGNPQNLFKGVKDVGDAKELLTSFEQFGEGIAGLYLTFLIKYSLAEFDNPEEILVKVDHHDIRILESIGILRLRNGRNYVADDEITNPLAQFMVGTSKKLGLDVIDLDSALWGLGVYGCTTKDMDVCKAACPLNDYCDQDSMLGSYYKDGRMYKGKHWKSPANERRPGFSQLRLNESPLLDDMSSLFERRAAKLSVKRKKKKIRRLENTEQLGLFND